MSNPSDQFPDDAEDRLPTHPDEKKQVHIPGAGTFGMVMLIISLSILFLASVIAVLFKRMQSPQWPPLGMPPVPRSLWLSTLVIIAASFTIHKALKAARRDNEKALSRNLLATMVIGVLFLLMQTLNWLEFYAAIRNISFHGPYLGMFFVLTGLHALHVIGGLIPLAVVYMNARRGRYSRNFHPGVRYVTIYWHFLDVIWLLLFCVLYF